VRQVELQAEAGGGGEFVVAADEDEELRAAAQWARQRLEESPEVRVAIIVPKLEDERAENRPHLSRWLGRSCMILPLMLRRRMSFRWVCGWDRLPWRQRRWSCCAGR